MAEKAAMSALAMSQYKELQASIGAGIDPTPAAPLPECVVRDATPEDVTAAASIVYTAFRQMADRHAVFNFTSQSLEHATSIVASCVDRKDVITKVATAGDEILGFVASTPISEYLYDLGPIAVNIEKQAGGIGRALVQAAVRCARGTTTLTVDTYNAQALALYCRCGFDSYGTLAVCERTRLTPKDPAAYPGLVVRRAKTSDLHACIKLADHYANTAMEREIQAHAETAWVVTQDDVVLGYCAALDMSGHSVFSMTLAAEALLGAAAPDLERPMVCVQLDQHPSFARWMFENGWRVVKTLLLMSTKPLPEAMPGAVVLPRC